MTLAVVLMNLWMPVFSGVLQGRQDFFWLGWAAIVSGVGRIAVAAVDCAGVSWRRDGHDVRRVCRPRRVGGHRHLAFARFVAGKAGTDLTDAACSNKSRR